MLRWIMNFEGLIRILIKYIARSSSGSDINRQLIEHELLNILLDMAVNGRSVFWQRMPNVVSTWKARKILQDDCTTNLAGITKELKVKWEEDRKEMKEEREAKASLAIVRRLSYLVSEDQGRRQAASQKIDFASETPVWLLADTSSEHITFG